MANVVVKLKAKTKKFNYPSLKDSVELSNLKFKGDIITGNALHYPEKSITKFTFGVLDYHGIATVDDWTSDDIDTPYIKDFGYIREVMECLLENDLI